MSQERKLPWRDQDYKDHQEIAVHFQIQKEWYGSTIARKDRGEGN